MRFQFILCLMVLTLGMSDRLSAQAQRRSAAEPMWHAVTIGETTMMITAVTAKACTKDGFEASTGANVKVSLSNIVKAGHSPDAKLLDDAQFESKMLGDDLSLRDELEKYDFRKVNSGRISKIFEDEWKPVARKYTSKQFGQLPQDMRTDLSNTLDKVAKRYETGTGVTIALDFAGGELSATITPRCRAVP